MYFIHDQDRFYTFSTTAESQGKLLVMQSVTRKSSPFQPNVMTLSKRYSFLNLEFMVRVETCSLACWI